MLGLYPVEVRRPFSWSLLLKIGGRKYEEYWIEHSWNLSSHPHFGNHGQMSISALSLCGILRNKRLCWWDWQWVGTEPGYCTLNRDGRAAPQQKSHAEVTWPVKVQEWSTDHDSVAWTSGCPSKGLQFTDIKITLGIQGQYQPKPYFLLSQGLQTSVSKDDEFLTWVIRILYQNILRDRQTLTGDHETGTRVLVTSLGNQGWKFPQNEENN